jgi:hypothetical protein
MSRNEEDMNGGEANKLGREGSTVRRKAGEQAATWWSSFSPMWKS